MADCSVDQISFSTIVGPVGGAAPSVLTEGTFSAWVYFDPLGDYQLIEFGASPSGPNAFGFYGNPCFSFQVDNFGGGGLTYGRNDIFTPLSSLSFITNGNFPTLPATPSWLNVIGSFKITGTPDPDTGLTDGLTSLALSTNGLGRGGDQAFVYTQPFVGDAWNVRFYPDMTGIIDPQIPGFPDYTLKWVLSNNAGFLPLQTGGINWVVMVPTYYDLTVQANRELFNADVGGGNLCPVDPTPLGPLLWMAGGTDTFNVNRVGNSTWTVNDGPLVTFASPDCFCAALANPFQQTRVSMF